MAKQIRIGEPIIFGVVFAHFVWGILLLFSPEPAMTTPLSLIRDFMPDHTSQGILFLSVSALSLAAIYCRWRLWFFAPQQVILFISLLGPIIAIYNGHYADLEPRPRIFIFADQLPAMIMAISFSVGIFIRRWYNG